MQTIPPAAQPRDSDRLPNVPVRRYLTRPNAARFPKGCTVILADSDYPSPYRGTVIGHTAGTHVTVRWPELVDQHPAEELIRVQPDSEWAFSGGTDPRAADSDHGHPAATLKASRRRAYPQPQAPAAPPQAHPQPHPPQGHPQPHPPQGHPQGPPAHPPIQAPPHPNPLRRAFVVSFLERAGLHRADIETLAATYDAGLQKQAAARGVVPAPATRLPERPMTPTTHWDASSLSQHATQPDTPLPGARGLNPHDVTDMPDVSQFDLSQLWGTEDDSRRASRRRRARRGA
jgi:hypothetical protein